MTTTVSSCEHEPHDNNDHILFKKSEGVCKSQLTSSSISHLEMQAETAKRPADAQLDEGQGKKFKASNGLDALATVSTYPAAATPGTVESGSIKRAPVTKARENRLEQNRKAARESRKRKKLMIEGEFERS